MISSIAVCRQWALRVAALGLMAVPTGIVLSQTTPPARPPAPKPAAKPAAAPAAPLSPAAQRRANLLDPTRTFWKAKAPASFQATFETSKGNFTLQFDRDWAPNGVDRFYNLARAGFFDDSRFYRVVYMFIAQFGLAADPTVARLWTTQTIRADSVREHNVRGTISFAQLKPTSRTTDLFINLRDNLALDSTGFTPIGRVIAGMEVADSLFSGYGNGPSSGPPIGDPKRFYSETNKFLDKEYPKLDKIIKVTVDTLTKAKPDTTRGR